MPLTICTFISRLNLSLQFDKPVPIHVFISFCFNSLHCDISFTKTLKYFQVILSHPVLRSHVQAHFVQHRNTRDCETREQETITLQIFTESNILTCQQRTYLSLSVYCEGKIRANMTTTTTTTTSTAQSLLQQLLLWSLLAEKLNRK